MTEEAETKNTQHTPGPWAADGMYVIAPNEAEYVTIARLPFGLRPRAGEDEANVALIASAPELLEECRFAAETFEGYAELHRQKDTEDGYAKAAANAEAAKRIRAVISKAESR